MPKSEHELVLLGFEAWGIGDPETQSWRPGKACLIMSLGIHLLIATSTIGTSVTTSERGWDEPDGRIEEMIHMSLGGQ